MPSLNALRAFETVSRHLTYSGAAAELGVTPAAVKQLVSKLEAAVGVALVERNGRGLALTPVGVASQTNLSRGFDQIAKAVSGMRATVARQRLIVSVEPSFATAWLVPRLDQFRAHHPDIDVLIDSSLQVVDLTRGVADIAIRFGAPPSDGQIAHRLFDETLCAFCSPALADGPPEIRSLDDLQSATLLHWDLNQLDRSSVTAKWMDWTSWLARVGADHVSPEGGVQFSDYNLAVQAAVAGHGVVLGSLPILKNLVDVGLLVRPVQATVVTDIGYDLVTSARAAERPEVAQFMSWILTEASEG